MFVIIEDCEILNIAQCIKIVVIRNEIKAYAPVIDSPMRSNLVARFDTEKALKPELTEREPIFD